MRVFITVLVLIFTLQSWTKADDISDFQIEGMSIGDSLLDYYSEEEINDYMQFGFKSKEFAYLNLKQKMLDTFDKGFILFKHEDKKFIIHSIVGRILFDNNIKNCKKKQKEIVNEFSELFKNISQKDDQGTFSYSADDSGKSKVTAINFQLNDGGASHVGCYEFSKEFLEENNYDPIQVVLSLSLGSAEYNNFQKNRAYE